jgi:hypothetical protein
MPRGKVSLHPPVRQPCTLPTHLTDRVHSLIRPPRALPADLRTTTVGAALHQRYNDMINADAWSGCYGKSV